MRILDRPLEKLDEERGLANIAAQVQITDDEAVIALWAGLPLLLGVCIHEGRILDSVPDRPSRGGME